MIGVGAGQQSRVDCVKLAGRKVDTWYMRQHPKVRAMKFSANPNPNPNPNHNPNLTPFLTLTLTLTRCAR